MTESTKHEHPENTQTPDQGPRRLVFGASLELEAWSLDLPFQGLT